VFNGLPLGACIVRARLLAYDGYDGVGIGPILAEAGVPKKYFYHFFPAKRPFAFAVLEVCAEHYRQNLGRAAIDTMQSPRQRPATYFATLEQELRGEQPWRLPLWRGDADSGHSQPGPPRGQAVVETMVSRFEIAFNRGRRADASAALTPPVIPASSARAARPQEAM
jgi:AcrR family transcriptional regulator